VELALQGNCVGCGFKSVRLTNLRDAEEPLEGDAFSVSALSTSSDRLALTSDRTGENINVVDGATVTVTTQFGVSADHILRIEGFNKISRRAEYYGKFDVHNFISMMTRGVLEARMCLGKGGVSVEEAVTKSPLLSELLELDKLVSPDSRLRKLFQQFVRSGSDTNPCDLSRNPMAREALEKIVTFLVDALELKFPKSIWRCVAVGGIAAVAGTAVLFSGAVVAAGVAIAIQETVVGGTFVVCSTLWGGVGTLSYKAGAAGIDALTIRNRLRKCYIVSLQAFLTNMGIDIGTVPETEFLLEEKIVEKLNWFGAMKWDTTAKKWRILFVTDDIPDDMCIKVMLGLCEPY
jgi:hypothetical protein